MKKRLGCSRSAAYNWLNVHHRFGSGGESVQSIGHIGCTALCLLAAPSVPDAAVEEIATQIKAGQTPSTAAVKTVIAKAKTAGKVAPTKPAETATTKPATSSNDAECSAAERKTHYAAQEPSPLVKDH